MRARPIKRRHVSFTRRPIVWSDVTAGHKPVTFEDEQCLSELTVALKAIRPWSKQMKVNEIRIDVAFA
jgi:hypothetical protein